MGHSLPCCAPADKAQRTRATVKTLPVNVRQTSLMVVSPPWWYLIASNRARAPNALDRARRPVKGDPISMLSLVKIDPPILVSAPRRHETPRQRESVAGWQQVFRPACGPAALGRSVRSCTWSPSREEPARRPRRYRSGDDPRTPPDRSD